MDDDSLNGKRTSKKLIVEETKIPAIESNDKDKHGEDDIMDTTSAKVTRYIEIFIDPVNSLVEKVSNVRPTDSSTTSSGHISRKPQNFNTNIYEPKMITRLNTNVSKSSVSKDHSSSNNATPQLPVGNKAASITKAKKTNRTSSVARPVREGNNTKNILSCIQR